MNGSNLQKRNQKTSKIYFFAEEPFIQKIGISKAIFEASGLKEGKDSMGL